MQSKTQRIILKTIKALGVVVLSAIGFLAFLYAAIQIAYRLTGDGSNAIIALIVPLLVGLCWAYAKDKVEMEISQEQDLINTLKRNYEQ